MRQTGNVGQVLCPVVVGRRAEIRALESALDGALAGRGGCVVITGEAGIGKSRLIRELARMAAGRRVPVVTGRAVPPSASAAYRPVTEALLQLLRRRPLPDEPSLAPWLPHLAVLLPGAAAGDRAAHPGERADSPAVRAEAVLQLLRRLSPGGLVVAMEDLHWADPDTVSLLEYLADNADGQPLLFAFSLRTEPLSPASDLARRQRGRPGIVHLPLDRLAEREVAEMIAACSLTPTSARARGWGGCRRACRSSSRSCWPRPAFRSRSARRCGAAWPGSPHPSAPSSRRPR
jgi:predicted ATPase